MDSPHRPDRRRSCLAVAGLVAVALAPLVAQAEVHYRWINERGVQVHSDRAPPPGIDYEVVDVGPSVVRPVRAEEGAVPRTIEPSPGNRFETVDPRRAEVEKNPEYCARARDNLYRLDNDARVRMRNEQGEVSYLEPEEREAERQKALKAIDIYCE
jgi:hypothetical protein